MRLTNLLAPLVLSLCALGHAVHAQVQSTPTRQGDVEDIEVPAPAWTVGQWWRLRVTSILSQQPRKYVNRVLEARSDGYVVQTVNEMSGAITTRLFSKDTNGISNAVDGYPVPSMIIETRPDDGRFNFPMKVGARWEHRYVLSNDGNVRLPTVVRGRVDRTVELDTAFGRLKTYQIEVWSQSEDSVANQETCMYLPAIGQCVEYRAGVQTTRVIAVGIEK